MLTQRTADIEIRTLHPYGFRSGEWASLIGTVLVRLRGHDEWRLCYDVIFPDGALDHWVVYDPDGQYQFRPHDSGMTESE